MKQKENPPQSRKVCREFFFMFVVERTANEKVLEREGFEELNEKDLHKEPYKSIYSLPDCFSEENSSKLKTHKSS